MKLFFCLALTILLPGLTFAIPLEFDGYLKNETAFRLDKSRDYTKIQNQLQLKLIYSPTSLLELVAISRATYDAVYDVREQDDEVREEYKQELAVRELYLDIYLANADIRIGKQQVVWGEAIGQRITDVINPQDLREFVLDDFIDSRVPLWLGKIDYYLGSLTIEGVWIPDFEPGKLAKENSEWEFTFKNEDSGTIPVDLRKTKYPEDGYEDSEWGVRVKGLYRGWDWAGSYFSTWDDLPTYFTRFKLKNFKPRLVISPEHTRLQIWGMSFTRPFGSVVFSGESACYKDKYFATEDPDDKDGNVKKDYLHYMMSAEYSPISQFSVTGQFTQKVIMNYNSDLKDDLVENGYSVYLRANFWHETLRPEILIAYAPDGKGSWINPEFNYDVSDTVNFSTGADLFEGDEDNFFGQFEDKDRLYVEIKYSF